MNEISNPTHEQEVDLTNVEEARKAFIASEMFNRKY